MPAHSPVATRMQLSAEDRSTLKAALAAIRQGGVVELYARLARLKQTVPFIFVTAQLGSTVQVAPLGPDRGGICTLTSITPAGANVKFQVDRSARTVHPSRVKIADTKAQLLAPALRSTRSNPSVDSGTSIVVTLCPPLCTPLISTFDPSCLSLDCSLVTAADCNDERKALRDELARMQGPSRDVGPMGC